MPDKAGNVTAVDIPEGLVTVNDLARYFKVSRGTIVKANKRGEIPGCHFIVGRALFDFALAREWAPREAVLRAEFGALTQEAKNGERKGLPVKGRRSVMPRSDTAVRLASHEVSKLPAREAKLYHRALVSRLTPEVWLEIIDAAIADAKSRGADGHRARVWLGNYVMGKAMERAKLEVDVRIKQDFSQAHRAVAIVDLLKGIQTGGGQVIDVTPRKVDSDAEPGPEPEPGSGE